ncbi:MAG: polysaccharide biosynthesis tyrosine autokinase [Ruminococcaceae bacterium]|nr:polysaccharide biosynthesis tyrosine autokinase [Oscillospiraceae bacterium]
MENQKKEKEITFGYLVGIFKKSFIFMIIAAVLLGAIGVVYSKFIEKPKYQTTSTFMVRNVSPESYYTSTLTMASTSIASSCVELATHESPRLMVAEYNELWKKLGYDSVKACADGIEKMITSKKGTDENSCSFSINIKSASRDVTYEITSALQAVFPEAVQQVFGNDKDLSALVTSTSYVTSPEDVSIVKSSPIKIGFILAVVAAVITYAVFFIKALFDKSIYNEDSIKENFSYPLVGVIPSFATPEEQAENRKFRKKKDAKAIAPRHYENKLLTEESPFHMTESFNSLRTNVIFSAAAAKNPVFAVTSDIAAAGKTVAAANLAISMSNLDKKVLLVECDMRCPSFTKLFGKLGEVGLSELLAGIESETSKVVHKYQDTSLDILLCGKIPPNPSELLSGYRMAELVEEWKRTYDYIILDMPPIGEVYDAGVVSNIINGYIVTARANHSNITNVRGAIERIESVNGNVLGMILNDVNLKAGKNYKSYYSTYAKAD